MVGLWLSVDLVVSKSALSFLLAIVSANAFLPSSLNNTRPTHLPVDEVLNYTPVIDSPAGEILDLFLDLKEMGIRGERDCGGRGSS